MAERFRKNFYRRGDAEMSETDDKGRPTAMETADVESLKSSDSFSSLSSSHALSSGLCINGHARGARVLNVFGQDFGHIREEELEREVILAALRRLSAGRRRCTGFQGWVSHE